MVNLLNKKNKNYEQLLLIVTTRQKQFVIL